MDLSWATPAATCMIRDWKVITDLEQLSDHRYISIKIGPSAPTTGCERRPKRKPRWALKKLDEDSFVAVILATEWSRSCLTEEDPQEGALRLKDTMTRACNSSMPRIKQCPRRTTYWWNEEIAEMRRKAIRLIRRVARCKSNVIQRNAAKEEYRAAKKSLSVAIKRAKAGAWTELLHTLHEDPWGRPYKLVLNKLRPRAPPVNRSVGS